MAARLASAGREIVREGMNDGIIRRRPTDRSVHSIDLPELTLDTKFWSAGVALHRKRAFLRV
jgi:hypothetical protein